MNYITACNLLAYQRQRIRKVDNVRFIYGKHEYRLTYRGGFAEYIGIDRREIGKRNFKYYDGFGAYNLMSAKSAIEEAINIVKTREEKK